MNSDVVEALSQLEREKGITIDALVAALEAALVSAYKRNYRDPSAAGVRVEIDRDGGDIKVYSSRVVTDTVKNPNQEVSLEQARAIDPNYGIGDLLEVEVTPADFGRVAAQTAKQVIMQKLREAEREIVFEEYTNKEGEVVTGIVQRRERRNVIVDLGRVEAIMPPGECVPGENYNYNDRIKVYIASVKKTPKGPQVVVSRTHPVLLKRLFEMEVPEIYDGIVEIKGIAREAGRRSKIAVISHNENVDAVGSCVGTRGMRVQKVVNELGGEKIDIVAYSEDPAIFVANALSPARVTSVKVYPETKTAKVIVPDNQLSLAIGREGQNARLAAKLTGWRVDIKSESAALLEPAEEYRDENKPMEADSIPGADVGEPPQAFDVDEYPQVLEQLEAKEGPKAEEGSTAEDGPAPSEEGPVKSADQEEPSDKEGDERKAKRKDKKKGGAREELFEDEPGILKRRKLKDREIEPGEDEDLEP